MKKILITALFVLSFGAYALQTRLFSKATDVSDAPTDSPVTPPADAVDSPPMTRTADTSDTPAPAPAAAAVVTATPTTGQYKDGTYTGSEADAFYGFIKVKAVIKNGKLSDVVFLEYPNDKETSRNISEQAMPKLKSEAIAAQSADVAGISGASQTKDAFVESLKVALAAAKA